MKTCSLSSTAEGAVYSGPSVFVISFTYNLYGLGPFTNWNINLKIQEAYIREHVFFLVPLNKKIYPYHMDLVTLYLNIMNNEFLYNLKIPLGISIVTQFII